MKSAISPASDVVFESFGTEHLAGAVALSTAAGWAHRREDWDMLLPFSNGIAAVYEGRVVGTAFRADSGNALSTVNMIIVEDAMRSQGLGRMLVSAAMGKDARCLRLVATPAGKPLYETLGFKTVAHIARVQGRVKAGRKAEGVRDAVTADIPEIVAMESASFGGDRSALIDLLKNNARIAVIQRGDRPGGFAACRRFGEGYVIGPVVASSADEGLALIAFLAEPLAGEVLRLDVTETSGLLPGLSALGLEVECLAPIMQRGSVFATSERLALFSQALA